MIDQTNLYATQQLELQDGIGHALRLHRWKSTEKEERNY